MGKLAVIVTCAYKLKGKYLKEAKYCNVPTSATRVASNLWLKVLLYCVEKLCNE